jgi:acetyl esterase/lipase
LSEARSELTFAKHDGVELKGDLYLPPGPGPHPVLVLFYGGAWYKGVKEKWREWCDYFTSKGIAAFAASYRLWSPGHSIYPKNIWDARSAIQFVRGKADELRVDPHRVGALGASAGGHLSSMLGLAGDSPVFASPYHDDPYPDLPAKVDVVIPINGVYDMIAMWEHDQLHRPYDHPTEGLLGGNPMNMRQRFYEASPMYHASAQNAKGTKWLIVWGTHDNTVDPETQAVPFVRHLSRTGAVVKTLPLIGAEHFWTSEPIAAAPQGKVVFDRIPSFLKTWAGW